MRHTLRLLACAIAVALSSLQALAIEIREVTSPGGITAWLVSDSTVPLIAMSFSFGGGAAADPADKQGRAHFLSGMLDEGAGELDSHAFQERMSDLTVRMSYRAGHDEFTGSFQTLSRHRDAAFDLLREAVTRPRFDAEPFEKVRGQILVNLHREAEDPEEIASNAYMKAAFGSHPYARPVKGTPDSLAALAPDDLKDLHRALFARDNLLISVVGDIDAETLASLLDRTFGGLPATSGVARAVPTAAVREGSLTLIERDIPQSVITFGMPGITRSDPDFIPAYVMNFVLGDGGFGSRLMEEIREKRGLTYGIYTGLVAMSAAGVVYGSVATQNERAAETLEVLRAELARMAESGPTETELADAKTYITGSYALRFDSNVKIARQLLGIQQDGLGIDYVDKRNALVEAVTLDDVKRAAKRLIDPDALTITIVGRPQGIPVRGGAG